MCFVAISTKFECRRKRSCNLSDDEPFSPRKFVLLMMVIMIMMMMMMTIIRSPQNVHSILLSHEHIHYNVFIMEK